MTNMKDACKDCPAGEKILFNSFIVLFRVIVLVGSPLATYHLILPVPDLYHYKSPISGYYCNEIGLPTLDGHECPVGHYCDGMDKIQRCPVGFMRDIVREYCPVVL